MRPRLMLASLLLTAAFALPAKAQVIVDMSLITCQQYFEAPANRQQLIA
jgi:hypothetical protein